MKNSCYTYFCIKGIFEPDIISNLLGLIPHETHKIGDIRKDKAAKYDYALWSFGICDTYDVEVDKQMLATIKPLQDKIDILKDIKKKYDVNFVLEVVPTVNSTETTPCLAPSLEVMKFCCDTETNIDIDLYID